MEVIMPLHLPIESNFRVFGTQDYPRMYWSLPFGVSDTNPYLLKLILSCVSSLHIK